MIGAAPGGSMPPNGAPPQPPSIGGEPSIGAWASGSGGVPGAAGCSGGVPGPPAGSGGVPGAALPCECSPPASGAAGGAKSCSLMMPRASSLARSFGGNLASFSASCATDEPRASAGLAPAALATAGEAPAAAAQAAPAVARAFSRPFEMAAAALCATRSAAASTALGSRAAGAAAAAVGNWGRPAPFAAAAAAALLATRSAAASTAFEPTAKTEGGSSGAGGASLMATADKTVHNTSVDSPPGLGSSGTATAAAASAISAGSAEAAGTAGSAAGGARNSASTCASGQSPPFVQPPMENEVHSCALSLAMAPPTVCLTPE
mmetsp:Transcript_167775/g.538813  ORF Transcript_167775/g.538813 Transcript_167775/m.538813 type:complete len:320 (+) Transcript_167775:472-1431(+)